MIATYRKANGETKSYELASLLDWKEASTGNLVETWELSDGSIRQFISNNLSIEKGLLSLPQVEAECTEPRFSRDDADGWPLMVLETKASICDPTSDAFLYCQVEGPFYEMTPAELPKEVAHVIEEFESL